MSDSALISSSRPAMSPLRVVKRSGSDSPTSSRHRTASGSTADGIHRVVVSSPTSTMSTMSFLKEVDDWITDIRSQLLLLESQHAKHQAWIASGGAEDAPDTDRSSKSSTSTADSEEADQTYISPSSFDSFRSKRSLNRNGAPMAHA